MEVLSKHLLRKNIYLVSLAADCMRHKYLAISNHMQEVLSFVGVQTQ